MSDDERVPTGEVGNLEHLRHGEGSRFRENQRRQWERREISEEEYYADIISHVEAVTGPLASWQRFYIIVAISGRGMEWASARGRPHYHILGLPCSICGRSGGLGVH